MSGADEAHGALRGALAAIQGPIMDTGSLAVSLEHASEDLEALRKCVARAVVANSLDSTMQMSVGVILAAESASKALSAIMEQIGQHRSAAVQVVSKARAALAQVMADTGCPGFEAGDHRADPLDGSERVEITDPARLPLALWKQPEPEPDKTAIRRALKQGPVPGAALVRGAPSIRISIRQESQR